MPLTRDQILAVADLKTATVDVPEWGGEVIVRTLSGLERAAYEDATATIKEDDGPAGVRRMALLVVATVVDESGKRVFTPDDIDALVEKGFRPLHTVFMAARALNLLTQADVEAHAKN